MALENFFNSFEIIKEQVVADDLGTHKETYKSFGTFTGAITTLGSAEGKKGEQPNPSSVFQLTTTKEVPLAFNDIVKDLATGSHYQIVTDRMATPRSAGLSIQQYTVKKVKINMI